MTCNNNKWNIKNYFWEQVSSDEKMEEDGELQEYEIIYENRHEIYKS